MHKSFNYDGRQIYDSNDRLDYSFFLELGLRKEVDIPYIAMSMIGDRHVGAPFNITDHFGPDQMNKTIYKLRDLSNAFASDIASKAEICLVDMFSEKTLDTRMELWNDLVAVTVIGKGKENKAGVNFIIKKIVDVPSMEIVNVLMECVAQMFVSGHRPADWSPKIKFNKIIEKYLYCQDPFLRTFNQRNLGFGVMCFENTYSECKVSGACQKDKLRKLFFNQDLREVAEKMGKFGFETIACHIFCVLFYCVDLHFILGSYEAGNLDDWKDNLVMFAEAMYSHWEDKRHLVKINRLVNSTKVPDAYKKSMLYAKLGHVYGGETRQDLKRYVILRSYVYLRNRLSHIMGWRSVAGRRVRSVCSRSRLIEYVRSDYILSTLGRLCITTSGSVGVDHKVTIGGVSLHVGDESALLSKDQYMLCPSKRALALLRTHSRPQDWEPFLTVPCYPLSVLKSHIKKKNTYTAAKLIMERLFESISYLYSFCQGAENDDGKTWFFKIEYNRHPVEKHDTRLSMGNVFPAF